MRSALAAALFGGLILVACGRASGSAVDPAETADPSGPVAVTPGASGAAGGARAEPTPGVRIVENVTTQTYQVPGFTAGEVRAYMNAYGPVALDDNRHYDGVTNWSVQWSFRFRSSGGCTISNATIEVHITMVLPELGTPEALSAASLARWQAYLDALTGHEQGHVDRELAGARLLKTAFEAITPAPTCAELGQTLNDMGQQHVEKIKAADTRYDLETGHGRTEGAVFP